MKYWWVNQNQTAKYEISGGYIWSPKKRKDGGRNQFYDNMQQVQIGDVVFSFYRSLVQHIGIATGIAATCPKPNEFGSSGDGWSYDGWIIPVKWEIISKPFRVKDIIAEIRPHLPVKYSPIQRETGNGLQGVYLAHIPESMANILMLQIGNLAQDILLIASKKIEDDEPIQNIDRAIEEAIRNNTSIDATEKESLIKARRGQGKFRQNISSVERCCRLTGVTDTRLLRASHIKPWRACKSNEERLDGYNGLLLTPTVDHIFDIGLISFKDNGDLIVSPHMLLDQLSLLGIDPSRNNNVGVFSSQQALYLSYHRDNVFQK